MDFRAAIENPASADARMLDRAEGVLMALRHCTIDSAFREILSASRRHRVPPLGIAAALVSLTQDFAIENAATAAARHEWGRLLDRVSR